MGDRTFSQVQCLPEDAHYFENYGWQQDDEIDGLVCLIDTEANYGGVAALENIANQGIVFFAKHDSGGEYPACVQVSDGEKFVDVEASEGWPVLCVRENGKIRFDFVLEYLQVYDSARKKLGLGPEQTDAIKNLQRLSSVDELRSALEVLTDTARIMEANGHLAAALIQVTPSDDQIIVNHIQMAKAKLDSVLDQFVREEEVASGKTA